MSNILFEPEGEIHDEARIRRRLRRLASLVLYLCLLTGLIMVFLIQSYETEEKRQTAQITTSQYARNIQDYLQRALSATFALAAVVQEAEGDIRDFERLAGEMLPMYPGVNALQLLPDGVIRRIYPLAGNEKAIGHNILTDPKMNREALHAIRTHQLVLAGPFELLQGGMGVVARFPVFLPDSASGKPRFWGFTNALVKIPDLLGAARLADLNAAGYEYELWRINPEDNKRQIFARSSEQPLHEPTQFSFEVPGGRWYFSIAPRHGWYSLTHTLLYALLATLFSIALTLLYLFAARYTLRQRQAIITQSEALEAMNQRLQEESIARQNFLEQVQHLAHHDGLTGLPNRLLFEERCEQVLQLAERESSHLALLLLDLDGFKPVNDNYGHEAGDEVLREVAHRLQACIKRRSDTVARLGGDEFIVLLPHLEHANDAWQVAELIRQTLAQPLALNAEKYGTPTQPKPVITLGASIGIACAPEHGNSPRNLLRAADAAMYRVKKSGKNHIAFADLSSIPMAD